MKQFVLIVKCIALISVGILQAQTVPITGTVTGADDGLPLIGVTVVVQGTDIGVATDLDGRYALQVPQGATSLVFSFVGLTTQVVEIAGRTQIDVAMAPDAMALEEIIVVAYGTATRDAFTGSASKLRAEHIAVRQVSNVTQALTGQMAGVQATSGTGQPGEPARIRIRGIGSMSASNAPLYVVDGIAFEGDISSINPNDIASITVLKDASAAAIYGARGANGVVIITTRRGERGEARVVVDTRWGRNSRGVPPYRVMTDPAMYYETFYRALFNSRMHRGYSAAAAHSYARSVIFDTHQGGLGYQVYTVPAGEHFIGTNFMLNPNATLGFSDGEYYYTPDDWRGELFDWRNLRGEMNVSVSGGEGKSTFFVSAGYLDDTGIVDGSGFTRYTARLSADYRAREWLKMAANLAYSSLTSRAPLGQTDWGSSGNLFYIANMIAPIYPMYVRNPDGSRMVDERGITMYDFGATTNQIRAFMGLANPAITLRLDDHREITDQLTSKWSAALDVLEGLQLNANVSANVLNSRITRRDNPFYGGAVDDGGRILVEHEREFALTQQLLLNYRLSWNRSRIEALAGYESFDNIMQGMETRRANLFNPEVSEIGNAISNNPVVDSYTDRYKTHGLLSRLQYDFDNRVFASASFRRDASSRFKPGPSQWGNFGSLGAAWVVSREAFFPALNAPWVDMLKLKASYGVQGNDFLLHDDGVTPSYYAYTDQHIVYNSDGNFATSLYYKGNPNITWETSYALNAGVEFTLFNQLLDGSLEFFNRRTVDLLFYQPVPLSLGYATIPMNVGSIVNRGVELDLNATLIERSNLTWEVSLNATSYRNRILDLAESVRERGIRHQTYIWTVGGSMFDAFLREFAGVDDQTGEALYYMADDDGEYVLDEDGQRTTTTDWSATLPVNLGSTLARLHGGFGTRVAFMGFDLAAVFTYQLGGRMYDFTYQELMHSGGDPGANWHLDILDAWSLANPRSEVPRLNASDPFYQQFSSRFLVSSDFLSLNSVTVGYTIPQPWADRLGIASARVFAVADNLALLTARRGLDPRQVLGVAGFDQAGAHRYTALRSLSAGVSLTF